MLIPFMSAKLPFAARKMLHTVYCQQHGVRRLEADAHGRVCFYTELCACSTFAKQSLCTLKRACSPLNRGVKLVAVTGHMVGMVTLKVGFQARVGVSNERFKSG